ncbi:MAG: endonuclease domain-containing protein [Beijerinckiaceae bacterium]
MEDGATNVRLAARREQRGIPTHIERCLWEVLRDRRHRGLKFRRQHSVGPYIADFFYETLQLVVEADGPVHDAPAQRAQDAKRDEWLSKNGLIVVRLPQDEIINAMPLALVRIDQAIQRCENR